MRHASLKLMVIALLGALPMAAYAIDQEMYNSIHGDMPAIPSGGSSMHQRVTDGTATPETTPASVTTDAGSGMVHKKQVSGSTTPSNVSAVDLDSSLATSAAPQGGNLKSPVGEGVIARMPGAEGR